MRLSSSVVLCTYNGARFLQAQWRSLLAQTRHPDEIVVRDDASTDETAALLDPFCAQARACGIAVRAVRNIANLGYVANFEAALRDAAGDVVWLCDQDDVWHPDKLAMQMTEFERRPQLLLLCGDARRVDAAGRGLPRSLFEVLDVSAGERDRIRAGAGFGVLLRRSLATGATVALRRTLLADALPIPPGWVHDEWLAIIAAALGGFDSLDSQLIDYRQHASNQIGMPERGFVAKWQDLRRPRTVLIQRLIARNQCLRERLVACGDRVPASCDAQVAEAARHLQLRAGLRGAPWSRAAVIAREARNGNYRRFGTGWRSMLRDFVRRG